MYVTDLANGRMTSRGLAVLPRPNNSESNSTRSIDSYDELNLPNSVSRPVLDIGTGVRDKIEDRGASIDHFRDLGVDHHDEDEVGDLL